MDARAFCRYMRLCRENGLEPTWEDVRRYRDRIKEGLVA